jgi:hypothetical protein
LYRGKQQQLKELLAEFQTVRQELSAGRQWLTHYMHWQLKRPVVDSESLSPSQSLRDDVTQHQFQQQSVQSPLEVATLAVYYRDLLRRAHGLADPADVVEPRLDCAEQDDEKLMHFVSDLFVVTDPQV